MPEPKAKRRRVTSGDKQIKTSDLTDKFGVKFDTDVKLMWKWALDQSPSEPLNCLQELLNLRLCGLFRYLHETATNSENTSPSNAVSRDTVSLHMLDREWQCPPEFQPCLQSNACLYGFWRDDPEDVPVFIVEKERGSGVLTPVATDILDLIRVLSKKQKTDLPTDLRKLIDKHASSVDLKKTIATRRKKVVARTFNKIGIVVPISKNDVGYRPLTMSYPELDSMLTRSSATEDEDKKDKILAPFDECINYIQFANDECDYGMGFEMGMCIFSHKTSHNFLGTISSLLPLSYELLGRNLFSRIMKRICEEKEKEQ